MTRASPHPRQPAPVQSGGRRVALDLAPALSAVGLFVVATLSFALLGGTLPTLPGGPDGPNGPIRTPTPSNVVVTDPRADVPGSMLYAKGGNIWLQRGDEARQLTSSGQDSMPAWSPDGASVYFVRTIPEEGRWPSAGIVRVYNLFVPRLMRVSADGSGEPEQLFVGRVRSGGNTWSAFIREPAISPDGTTAAIITDAPDPTTSNPVLKLLDLASGRLTDPGLPESQGLGHASPAWSPNGQFVVYVRNAREASRGTPLIARYNPITDRSVTLTTGGYANPSWSRDGRYIAATRTSSFGTDVVVLDARNGTELLRVTHDESSFSPAWSPAGDAIAFYRLDHGVVDLYLVPLEGDAPAWTVGEPVAMTISAGLDGSSRPVWFIPADELPPLPTPTAAPTANASAAPASTTP